MWTGRLLSEARFGHVIIVGGTVNPSPIKYIRTGLFMLNILTILLPRKHIRLSISFAENDLSRQPDAAILLHLDVRFSEKQIVRSSHFPGVGWSSEQISDHLIGRALKNPLRGGQPFAVRLTVLQAIFQVHINDELYCTYDHEPPAGGIRYVHVQHDFEQVTCFAHRQLFPDVYPLQPAAPASEEAAVLVDSATTTADGRYVFAAEVPHAMAVGTAFTLSGWAAGERNARFAVDVLANGSERVRMRFEARFGEKLVARNAQRLDGRFHGADEERRAAVFPFKRGQEFRLTVHVTRECYVFYVNGAHFARFNHRQMPAGDLATIKCWATADTLLAVQRVEFVRDFVAPPAAEQ